LKLSYLNYSRDQTFVWAVVVAQLQTFLQHARSDRFFALWVLEATSGMRRCELAGVRRDLLDLDAGTLAIEVTRVVVDGRVIESDGKTENAQHVLALDRFTLAVLKAHVETLDQERRELGLDYQDHGVLFCWRTGGRRTRTRSRDGSRSSPRRPVFLKLTFMTSGTATPRLAKCRDRSEDRSRPDRARQHGLHAQHLHTTRRAETGRQRKGFRL
jgi:integrase